MKCVDTQLKILHIHNDGRISKIMTGETQLTNEALKMRMN